MSKDPLEGKLTRIEYVRIVEVRPKSIFVKAKRDKARPRSVFWLARSQLKGLPNDLGAAVADKRWIRIELPFWLACRHKEFMGEEVYQQTLEHQRQWYGEQKEQEAAAKERVRLAMARKAAKTKVSKLKL